jgi:ribonuclease G
LETKPNFMTATPKSPTREIVIHERIGELRAALFDRGRIVELRLERWSTHASRVRWGQVYAGRITGLDTRLGGAFVDLGVGEPAFAPFPRERDTDLHEGLGMAVRVVREAEGGKGPTVAFEGPLAKNTPCPSLITDVPPWHGWPGDAREADEDEIERIDAAFDAALSLEVPIPDGGRLTIERTRALTAIDVDSAGRATGGSDAARFARGLNLAAVPEVVRQIRLRGLGGLICVDFTGPRKKGDTEALTKALTSAFDAEKNGGVAAPKTDVLPVSRFGIAEIARQKRRQALADICLDHLGNPTGETVAIEGIARLAHELTYAKGREVTLFAPASALAFLEADTIGWREEIATAVGGVYKLRLGKPTQTRCEVVTA